MKLNGKRLLLLLAALVVVGLLFGSLTRPADTAPTTELPLAADAGETLPAPGENAALPELDTPPDAVPGPEDEAATPLDEDGSYTTAEDVSLYLITYGHLPSNFITKREAEAAGWSGGSLEKTCPGKCIGGDRFGNREGLLPSAPGRTWTECDINTLGARSRGAERLVFSNDGLIYYTADHYESFQLLYGEP